MGSAAGKYQIIADQGATFQRVLTWKDSTNTAVNLTGYTARMHIRNEYESTSFVLALTTENSRIALGGATGRVTLTVDATTMTNLFADTYVYDLELVSGAGVVTRLVMGTFTVRREVTR
jgi:hypothetical protein